MKQVLILGSAPMALQAAEWPRAGIDALVAINNAYMIRPDWDYAIYPWDFPPERHPVAGPGQRLVTENEFVPAQNAYGGFVYAGATMAYTAAYWALAALRPQVIAMFGCDMHYPATGATHFYGTGSPDPLRADITLRSLEAKSARLMVLAAMQGCAMINLSNGPSRLVFPRGALGRAQVPDFDAAMAEAALAREAELDYVSASGRYWQELERFDASEIDALDAMWMAAV
ncbi:MAG: hypothetical protein ABIQ85_12120 [Cypionkella sp.]